MWLDNKARPSRIALLFIMKYILFEWYGDGSEPIIEAGPSWDLPATKWWTPTHGWVDYTLVVRRLTMDELRQDDHGLHGENGRTVRVIDKKEAFLITL